MVYVPSVSQFRAYKNKTKSPPSHPLYIVSYGQEPWCDCQTLSEQ